MTKQTRVVSKKQKILIAVAGAVVVLVGWWAYVSFMPHPLGDKLEYLGKEDLGGGFFFYDYHPYSEYYYGTDMTADELKAYFSKARYDTSVQDSNVISATYSAKNMNFVSEKGDFTITYYSDAKAVLESAHLRPTNKKNVVSITDSTYDRVKSSL